MLYIHMTPFTLLSFPFHIALQVCSRMQSLAPVEVHAANVSKLIVPPFPVEESPSPQLPVIDLSFFDTLWIFIPPIGRVLFYETPQTFPFDDLLQLLKSSLTTTLQHFYSLTGKIICDSKDHQLKIDCSCVEDGIEFVDAEATGDLQRLISYDLDDVGVYQSLLPKLNIGELPASVLSVKVTHFLGGGLAIGISAHHMAIDGAAYWHFVREWSKICRTGVQKEIVLDVQPSPDRSSIKKQPLIENEAELSKTYVATMAPSKLALSLPKSYEGKSNGKGRNASQVPSPTKQRSFPLSTKSIQLLKQRSIHGKDSESSALASTFVAVAAHIWICTTKARGIPHDATTRLFFAVDCRSRLDPPVKKGFVGNCVRPGIVDAKVSELLDEDGFILATRSIRRVIDEVSKDPLKDCMSWADWYAGQAGITGHVHIGGSPRFGSYELDFGWGKPCRVETVSNNCNAVVTLCDLKDDQGGVQVSISLTSDVMDSFTHLFMDGMDKQ